MHNYTVNVENGVITSPNVATFSTSSGAVRASIAVQEKHTSGSGKLTGVLGRWTWMAGPETSVARDPGLPSGPGSYPRLRG